MSRSLSYLRRGLLGIFFVGSMGFGVKEVFAKELWVGISEGCEVGDPTADQFCTDTCYYTYGFMRGRCNSTTGACECRYPTS